MTDAPIRVRVALILTVLGLGVLAAATILGGEDDPQPDGDARPTTVVDTSTTQPSSPSTMAVQPDWYRKGNSRYSERGPAPTVSSLPSTTAASTTITRGSGTTRSGGPASVPG